MKTKDLYTMWIEIEGGVLVNMAMLTDIRPDHRNKSATLYAAGRVVCDSSIIYQKVFIEKILEGK